MPCHPLKFNGGFGIACTARQRRRKCRVCGERWASKLCDFPTGNGTCDAPLCDPCAVSVGPDRDFCPSHDRVQPPAVGAAMKALTIWQPWATLIIAGAKPYEFRGYPLPKYLRGQRSVIHAGVRPIKIAEVRALLWQILGSDRGSGLIPEKARPILESVLHGRALPLGCGLGTVQWGEPQRATDLYPDSDRADHHKWGWPVSDIKPFEPFVPCRGAQGFWTWPERVVE